MFLHEGEEAKWVTKLQISDWNLTVVQALARRNTAFASCLPTCSNQTHNSLFMFPSTLVSLPDHHAWSLPNTLSLPGSVSARPFCCS